MATNPAIGPTCPDCSPHGAHFKRCFAVYRVGRNVTGCDCKTKRPEPDLLTKRLKRSRRLLVR